jgi:hypothetical protein
MISISVSGGNSQEAVSFPLPPAHPTGRRIFMRKRFIWLGPREN